MKTTVVETKRAAFRLSHDAVAPSECYKAAYDTSSFPRSVFHKTGEGEGKDKETRSSIIKRIFLKPKEKKENVCVVGSTPVIKVSVKRKAELLQEISLQNLKSDGKTRLSTHCLNTTECDGGKLPNAIVNKIFKVLVVTQTFMCVFLELCLYS